MLNFPLLNQFFLSLSAFGGGSAEEDELDELLKELALLACEAVGDEDNDAGDGALATD